MSVMIVDPYSYGMASEPVSIEYLGAFTGTSPVIDLGDEHVGRLIVLAFALIRSDSAIPTSFDLGGTPGTVVVSEGPFLQAFQYYTSILVAFEKDTGTTATLTPTWTAGSPSLSCFVYRVTGADSATPVDAAGVTFNVSGHMTATVDVQKDGGVICAVTARSATGGSLEPFNLNSDFSSGGAGNVYLAVGSSQSDTSIADQEVGFTVNTSTGKAAGTVAVASFK